MAAITLDIGGNTRRLDRDIQKTVNRVYSINLKTKGDQPLGRITGKVNEFNKSLDASNARVIAFGASAGIIFGVERAFGALVQATIEVQKSLQDINVILNASQANLQKFGAELFSIARNTGQSFQAVAQAATEFSRQGLGLEETLKRTNEALILSRLSGLDTVKSVEALTAAVNSFASQAVTATEIVNKFATVDAAFAVSSADLADAIARVGSSAAQSGVSLNELIAIVTSAQQTTARGGAVIGNSFKTIFTRLQREKVVDLLESLGISGTNASGEVKSTIQLLQELGTVYDTLGSQQQAYVAEQVGGVFQINILKAALADLGKEYSIYSSALNVAAGATDQAIRRNEELNKTYSAQINALQENARQLAAAGGERLLGPSIDRLVGGTNTLLKGFSESDGQGVGAVLGKGILDGIGQFIAGPGLALIGGVLLKLFRDLAKFATGSVQQLLGLNTAATQQRDLQQSINSILAKNPQLLELALKGEQGLNTAANSLLASLQKQTVELQKQAAVAQQISKAFIAQAGVRVAGGVPVVPTGKTPKAKSGGFIPNFSVQSELTGIKKSGDYTSSQKRKAAGDIRTANFPGIGPTVFNGQETIAKSTQVAEALGYPKGTKPKNPAEKYSILTPKMSDDLSIAAKGFIPNFANSVRIADIATSNVRIRQKLESSLKNRGNLEGNDQIQVQGIKSEYFNPNTNKNIRTSGLSGKQYEKRVLNEVLKGGGWKDNRGLAWSGSSAIDAYRIKGQTIELAEMKGGRFLNQLVLNKFLRAIPENYGSNNELGNLFKENRPGEGLANIDRIGVKGVLVQASKPNQTNITSTFSQEKLLRAKTAESKANEKFFRDRFRRNFSSGFIPNFAQTATQPKIVELGDTTTNPLFRGKVSTLIYPQISEGKSKAPAETTYLGKKYKGLVSTAGINKKALQGEIPDLEKNLDQLLLREANEFGRAIGGTEFLQSASELPNIGAAKGAVGVSFEGGLLTLLKRDVQKSAQNARIDFTQDRINTKFKSLFHGAPGTYEAKYSPSLTGEVLQKMLRGAGVGEVKRVKSGPGAGASLKQREAVLASIDKDVAEGKITQPRRGNALEAEIRRRLPLLFPGSVKGAAAGFIPNFAPLKLMGDRKKEYEDFVLEPVRGGKLKDKLWDRNPTREQRLRRVQQSKENKAAFDKIKNLPITANALDNLKFYRDKRSDQYDSSGKMVLYKDRDGLLNSREVRSHEYSGLESNAITVENGRVVLEDYSPNSSKKIPFNSEFKPLVSTMASALGMGVTTRSALTKQLSTSRVAAIRNSPLYKAEGFIPNFAAEEEAKKREMSLTGSAVTLYSDRLDSPVVVNKPQIAKYGPNADKIIKKDHIDRGQVGTKSNLMKTGSGREKYKAGGYIPNFAETPESTVAGIGTVGAALVSQLGLLAFSFQGFNQQYKESLSELTKSNIENAKKNLETAESTARRTEKSNLIKEKKVGGVRQQSGGILAAQQEAKKNQESINKSVSQNKGVITAQKSLTKAEKGGISQKLNAGGRAGGFGLALAAPILAQTLSQGISTDTKEGRVKAAGVGALGNIGAATATGAIFGPVGAAVGLAAGALLEIPNVVGTLSTNFPELQAAVQKSSQELTKFSDAGSQLLTSFENLQTALKDPNTSQDMINKASDAYAKALMGLSSEDQKRLKQAAEIGNLEEEYAKILSEKTSELKSRESAAEAGRIAGEAEKTNNLIDMGLGVATAIPGFAPTALALKESGLVEALRPKALEIGSKEDKSNQQAFVDQILQGKTGKDAVGALEKAGGTNFVKELLQIQPGDTKALEDLLNKTIPEGAGKADFVAAQIQMANNGTADFGDVIGSLGTAFTQTTVKARESVKNSDALIAAQQKEAKAKEEATKATEQIIDSLQRNIRMAQMAADTNRALAKANSEFQRNTAFADTYSRPTETVGTIVGQGAPLAEAFSLREDVARIGFNQTSNIENVKFSFVNEINESIKSAFDDAVGETTKKASGEGTAADIQKGNKEILGPLAGQQEKAFAVVQDVLNKSLAGGGDIQTEALLSDISKSLQDANINSETIAKITDQVREGATKGNLEITKLRDQSIKEFKTLAKEQTQKILIAKIQQAQKFGGASVGGGIEEFINPKEPGQGVFDKVVESTQGFEQFQGKRAGFRFDYMPGTNQFKYQYAEAKAARREMAPERGQKALALIDQLQDFTGYTPNAEGKAVQAGVAGLTEFFNKQIKELENIAKTTSDPIVREEINAALKEVGKLGGTKNIARLQVAQRTGALTEKGYKEITGKFQNPVLESLQEQIKLVGTNTPEGQLLAQQLEELQNVTITSQDPTIQAINSGNVVLKQILDAIKNEATGTTGMIEPFDIEAYTKEKDPAKRAAIKAGYGEITSVNTGLTTGEAVKNQIKAIQDKVLPTTPKPAVTEPQKTIAEIEAETRAKRDQKLGAQSQTGIYTGGYINGMRANEAIIDPDGQQAQTEFQQFRSQEAQRKAAADAELQRVLAEKEVYDAPARTEFEQFRQSQQIVDPRNDYALEEDRLRREMIEGEKMRKAASPLSTPIQNQQSPAAAQQSFAQQEAAFNSNTSALTSLAGGIENLNSTLANFESNFANLNNVPGTQQVAAQQAGAQPGAQTTTNAPVNVVVNAQGSNDIAAAVGEAVQNAIPTIIDKVRVALGQKVPPTSNPKFGGGQRADGGFLL